MKEKLPNSTAALVLGIFSIITCCFYGLPSIILGVVAFIQGNKAIAIDNENPEMYEGVGNAKAGKITGIVGIVLGAIYVVLMLFALYYFGWEVLNNEELLQEKIQELSNQ